MTDKKSGIRGEFERAFESEFGPRAYKDSFGDDGDNGIRGDTALWAAKWMAEKCAKIADDTAKGHDYCENESGCDDSSGHVSDEIRQLAKDLNV